jgi:hypothetical protein
MSVLYTCGKVPYNTGMKDGKFKTNGFGLFDTWEAFSDFHDSQKGETYERVNYSHTVLHEFFEEVKSLYGNNIAINFFTNYVPEMIDSEESKKIRQALGTITPTTNNAKIVKTDFIRLFDFAIKNNFKINVGF